MKKYLILFFMLILAPLGGSNTILPLLEDKAIESERLTQRLSFARHLETQNDYYRAITEYKRQMFLSPDLPTQRKCYLGLARSYFAGKKWLALEQTCAQARSLKGYQLNEQDALKAVHALALWNLGHNKKAYDLVQGITNNNNNTLQLKAWTAFSSGQQQEAEIYFTQAGQNQNATNVKNYHYKEKSPLLAGTLSALIPGAGQYYTGNNSAALGAFFVNALLIASTIEAFDEDQEILGTGLGLLALGFYSGNIYGAINFAHKHNQVSREDWLARKTNLAGNYKESIILDIKIPF